MRSNRSLPSVTVIPVLIQYTVEDPAGHQWTFSETLDDIAPEAWGGILVTPGRE